MRLAPAVLAILLFIVLGPSGDRSLQAQSSPPGFADSIVLSGLRAPTVVAFSPDGRVFVGEKSGIIRVFDSLEDTTPTVFADLRTQVYNYLDRGLLGMALHPDFPARPYLYVLYVRDADIGGVAPKWGTAAATSDACPTSANGGPGGLTNGCTASGRLSRLTVSTAGTWTGGEHVLIDGWFQQFPSHSMGSVAFGADGALYASAGDGAHWQFADYGQTGIPLNPAGDPPVPIGGKQTPPTAEGGALRAQDLWTDGDPVGLNGTVIRINADTAAGLADNPLSFHADLNARRIAAYGLRNPFRIAVRPGTGELWRHDQAEPRCQFAPCVRAGLDTARRGVPAANESGRHIHAYRGRRRHGATMGTVIPLRQHDHRGRIERRHRVDGGGPHHDRDDEPGVRRPCGNQPHNDYDGDRYVRSRGCNAMNSGGERD